MRKQRSGSSAQSILVLLDGKGRDGRKVQRVRCILCFLLFFSLLFSWMALKFFYKAIFTYEHLYRHTDLQVSPKLLRNCSDISVTYFFPLLWHLKGGMRVFWFLQSINLLNFLLKATGRKGQAKVSTFILIGIRIGDRASTSHFFSSNFFFGVFTLNIN